MGGTVSVEHAEIITVAEDGAIGLTEKFAQKFENDMPFPIKRPVVTRQHEDLIKANWSAICQGTSAFDPAKHLTPTKFFYRTFYNSLFEAAPGLRPIFRSSMTVQGKSLAGIIKVLATVVNGANVIGATHDLAVRHLKYGAQKDHYTAVGGNLLKTLEVVSGDKWNEQVKEAYLTAYCLLYYLMLPVILSNEPAPITESLDAKITASDAVAPNVKRITINFDFPLRFYPGDSILLGLPLESGEVRRHYTIASAGVEGASTIDIFVHDSSPSSHWLTSQAPGAALKLFWIESNVRFEIDTPETLPANAVFIGHGIGCVPLLVLLEGLYRARETFRGTAVTLQCAADLGDIEPLNAAVGAGTMAHEWERSTVHYADTVTADKLKEIAPHAPQSDLFVCGPPEFVSSATDAFVAAGGAKERIHIYSFDNAHLSPIK